MPDLLENIRSSSDQLDGEGVGVDFLSGDLDRVFTVLFEMGKIEPLLKKDWNALYKSLQSRWPEVSSAIQDLNRMSNRKDMRIYLEKLPPLIIDALVVEVARELAEYHGRNESLH